MARALCQPSAAPASITESLKRTLEAMLGLDRSHVTKPESLAHRPACRALGWAFHRNQREPI